MAIVANGFLTRLAFADREQYASPYPIGLAVAHVDVTGDATGGGITVLIEADGGFLYRPEIINATRSDVGVGELNIIVSSRILTDRSGLGPGAFDLNWHLQSLGQGGFSVYTPFPNDMQMIRRQIIGRTDTRSLQTIFTFNTGTNTNLVVHDFDLICSYWETTSLVTPGFLQAFYESPIAAP